MQDISGNFAQDLFSRSATEFFDFLVDTVETAAFTEFHGYGDGAGRFVHKGAIVLANVFGCAVFVEFEFAQDLFLDIGVRACRYDLESHVSVSRMVDREAATYLQGKHGFGAL